MGDVSSGFPLLGPPSCLFHAPCLSAQSYTFHSVIFICDVLSLEMCSIRIVVDLNTYRQGPQLPFISLELYHKYCMNTGKVVLVR